MLQGDRGKQLPRGFAPHHLGPPPVRPQMGKPFQSGPYQQPNGQFGAVPPGRQAPALNSLPVQSPLYRSAGMLPGAPVAAVRLGPSANAQPNNQTRMNTDAKLQPSSRMSIPMESFETDPSAIYDGNAAQFVANGSQISNQGQYSGTPLPIPQERASAESYHAERSYPAQIDYSTSRSDSQISALDALQDSDRIRIRTEADRIAERLLKTEADLERLRKQGDLIGESLRKQKMHDVTSSFSPSASLTSIPNTGEDLRPQGPPPARPRSPLSRSRAPIEDGLIVSLSEQPATLYRERSSSNEREQILSPASENFRTKTFQSGQEYVGDISPIRSKLDSGIAGSSSPKRFNAENNAAQLMQPAGGTLQTLTSNADPLSPARGHYSTSLSDEAKSRQNAAEMPTEHLARHAPTLNNKSELAQKQLSAEECAKLGLPPGTMWFDPSSQAQMKLITDQLKASKAEAAAKAAAAAGVEESLQTFSQGRSFPTGPIRNKTYTDEEIRRHFANLYLPETATLSQAFGAYKRLAPRAFAAAEQAGDFSELEQISESYKCCESVATKASEGKLGSLTTIGEDDEDSGIPGAANGGTAQADPPLDIHQLYRSVFSSNVKKGELHVQLGVSLEDLVLGYKANFTYERMVCMEDGSVQPEKCQLCIDILPGMRPGLEFIFDNEGDDAPGHVPGDVKVTLCAEPHHRFFWAGNDLATQITISLASALLGGVVGEVKSITNEMITLDIPSGIVIFPGAVFKVRGEGLPLHEDPRRRGDLFVRFVIEFPKTLEVSSETARLFAKISRT